MIVGSFDTVVSLRVFVTYGGEGLLHDKTEFLLSTQGCSHIHPWQNVLESSSECSVRPLLIPAPLRESEFSLEMVGHPTASPLK